MRTVSLDLAAQAMYEAVLLNDLPRVPQPACVRCNPVPKWRDLLDAEREIWRRALRDSLLPDCIGEGAMLAVMDRATDPAARITMAPWVLPAAPASLHTDNGGAA